MRAWDVYAKSGGFFVGAGIATLTLNAALRHWIRDPALHLAAAFSIIAMAATIAIAVCLFAQRSYARFQKGICDQLRPAIEEHVMALAFAGQAWPAVVPRHGLARRVLEQCLAAALSGLRDSSRNRVSQFAVEQGFARQWQKAFLSRSANKRKRAISLLGLISNSGSDTLMRTALHDRQPAIRIEAARALLAAGDPATVDRIFRSVLGECLLVRVLLTGDLKRHARPLLANTIPAVLAENECTDTINCLEILTTWKLAIPGLDIGPLLDRHRVLDRNRYRYVLPLLVSLLPYVSVEDSIEDHLLSALEMEDLEVQCAAAYTAGQLKQHSLIPALARLLNQDARLGLACATALAQMGAAGERNLRSVVSGPDRRAAAAAMEALETLTVGTP